MAEPTSYEQKVLEFIGRATAQLDDGSKRFDAIDAGLKDISTKLVNCVTNETCQKSRTDCANQNPLRPGNIKSWIGVILGILAILSALGFNIVKVNQTASVQADHDRRIQAVETVQENVAHPGRPLARAKEAVAP